MTALLVPTCRLSYVPIAERIALSPAINCAEPLERFVTCELTIAEPSYTLLIEAALRLGVVISKGLTSNEPTTTSSSNPVLLGLAVDVRLY